MMTSESREIEFKFAVSDSQAFTRLLQHLKFPDSLLDTGVTQTNHFFDSPALCLHENHFVIRLREANGSHVLTVKGERQSQVSASEVLSSRIEEEVPLPQQAADDLLHDRISPRAAVAEYFGPRSVPLLGMIDGACQAHALIHIGQFDNRRIHLPPVELAVENGIETVEFELDSSTFPDGSVEYEMEIEITAHSDAAGIEAALIELFSQAGIEWHSAASKAVRFFAALEKSL